MAIYIVKSGDTLGKIARRFYGDAGKVAAILTANVLANPDKLRVGQRLTIPYVAATAEGAPPLTPEAAGTVVASGPVSNPMVKLNEQRLSGVNPILAIRARCMIDLCGQAGIALLVSQGLRTWAEQDALYAKGRTAAPIGNKHVVTKAKGGQSWHNFGLAFDIVVLDSVGKVDWDTNHPGWKQAAEIGKSVGLEWGGDWTGFKDLPHFQYTSELALQECRDLFADGLEAIWSKVT